MTNTLWMEKPLCKICEPPRRHWSSEPHQFKSSEVIEHEVDPTPVRSAAVKVDGAVSAVVVPEGKKDVSVPRPRQETDLHEGVHAEAPGKGGSTHRYRDPDKWRAYMKEYMRKRRAK